MRIAILLKALVVLLGTLTFSQSAKAQWCWFAYVTDFNGSGYCTQCASIAGVPKYEPYASISCFFGCVRCNTIIPRSKGEQPTEIAACSGSQSFQLDLDDPAPAVNVAFGDALKGQQWEEIVNDAPEHALFFLGMKYKFDAGYAANVRDWHVMTPFMPTRELVRLMERNVDASLQDIQAAATPLNANEIVKVEVRGRQLDDEHVEIELTTVLESSSSPTAKASVPLYSRKYLLLKSDVLGPKPVDAKGNASNVYVLGNLGTVTLSRVQ